MPPTNVLISAAMQAIHEHNLAHPEDPISEEEAQQVVDSLLAAEQAHGRVGLAPASAPPSQEPDSLPEPLPEQAAPLPTG